MVTTPCSIFPYMIIGVMGLQITDLRVPQSVRNGSEYAILDCEYALLPEDLLPNSGLVIKWFYNNEPVPVYQWIPGQMPQDLGRLKGRLDLSYRATDHNASMHRALFIRHPTTELSGEYKCVVSTFREEDFMNKKMIVFAPETKLIFTQYRKDLDTVNISCWAQGVYPEPKMALYKDPDRHRKQQILDTKVDKFSRYGSYDIKASALIQDLELSGPTIFDCKLWIPDANYSTKKSIVFYSGIMGFVSESYSTSVDKRNALWIALTALLVVL